MVTLPESMDEVIYFTRRVAEDRKIIAWVYKAECPKCHKAKMGKPVEGGKVKIRAKEYVCPECNYREEKVEHEEKLMVEIQYTCPYCKKSGEATTEYKRKSFDGVPSYVFTCTSCKKKIGISKKMKQKGAASSENDDDE